MRPEPSHDTNFYIIGWSCIGLIFTYVGMRYMLHIDLIDYMPSCFFYTATGFYCPGCGGTRAVFAFMRGDILKSIFFHPFVPFVLIVGGWFMISQTIQRLSHGKIQIGMHFRMIYVWISLILIAINFLWKNVVLLFTGIALM